MFRENVLVDPQFIERVSEVTVPVALDYQKVLDRDSPEARFLLPRMHGRSDKQGVWIFAPDGKVLGRFVGFGDMLGRTRRVLEDALKAFGPVEPRKLERADTRRDRGKGFRPDGSVRLAEYVRRRDPDRIRSPVVSSVVLSAEEFRAFAPRRPAEGEAWRLPEEVAKKLCRLASPMCYQHAPKPDWVKEIAFEARVRTVRDGIAELVYKGTMSSERAMGGGKVISEQELVLEGEGHYDISRGTLRSLLIVGSGTFRWPEEAPGKRVLFDALLEWDSVPEEATAGGPRGIVPKAGEGSGEAARE